MTTESNIQESELEAGADAAIADEAGSGVVGEEMTAEERVSTSWFEDDSASELEVGSVEYDITSSPNDFNIRTIVDFVGSGAVKIPGFQRNYVWDIRRASRLIESLLVGLPIPQVFLYEEARNSFLVIDGQQRLMSIYYFMKGRFPRREKRPALRHIMDELGTIPDAIMADDTYFQKFNLNLPGKDGRGSSKFDKKNLQTLGDYKTTLEMRTIRNVVVKQTAPEEERDSSVFEIFNRLNTGGVNLRSQEIRSSLYHSPFTMMLHRVNILEKWRSLIGLQEPDLHEKDIEILLRVAGLSIDGDSYKEPMAAFLNSFARKARSLDEDKIGIIEQMFSGFFDVVRDFTADDFAVPGSGRFSIAVFEAVFRAVCYKAAKTGDLHFPSFTKQSLADLKADAIFQAATRYGVGRTAFVKQRFDRARLILGTEQP